MLRLVTPDLSLHDSFLQALVEYHREGRHLDLTIDALREPAAFARYLATLRADARAETHRSSTRVPQTNLWWADDDQYLGRISIRHELNAGLRRIGGHIGYEIRPSARLRGNGKAMLAAALPVAAELGIDPALITCDATNAASRRVIESNGGRYAGRDGSELHFWVPTSDRPRARAGGQA
ncbi:MAG TPA: GNAT family N-acetyltransferase [Thermoleophilia bacterium]|nr:GNAT family N-acetyltransferase [Thermoleophilia bacterium]